MTLKLVTKTSLIISLFCFVLGGHSFAEVSPEEAQKITDAAPSTASAKAAKPRKVLVFSLCQGWAHTSIPYCSKAIEVLGEKTGAYTSDDTKDKSVFTTENLKQYDAIIFNNTTKLTFDEPQRKAIMDFVKGGKGIVGIHGATDNFNKWPEAAEMIGGIFAGHPWGSGGTWAVKIEDPENPVAAAFKGKDFKINDEIYRTKQINLRENARVLLGLDMTDATNLSAAKITKDDIDIPISWIRDFVKGRVFYCSLGHNHDIFWNRTILQHYLDGIQFAMGDLDADTTPLALDEKLSAGPDIKVLLEAVSDYEYGQSRQGLTDIEKVIKDSLNSPERLLEIEIAMATFIGTGTTSDSKQFVCRQLGLIGTTASAEILGQMLVKNETSDMARYALERIPSSTIDDVLLDGLGKTTGKARIGIINSIGARRTNSAVGALSKLASDSDKDTVIAAINSLGNIASADAAAVLGGIIGKVDDDFRGLAENSYLKCADQLVADGKEIDASEIYNRVSGHSSDASVKRAAFRGLVEVSDDPSNLLILTIDSRDPVLQGQAISMSNMIEGTANIKKAAGKIKKLPAGKQVQLLLALADSGDGVILPAVLESIKSSELEVRIAAIQALRSVGNPSVVGILASIAANTGGEEQAQARRSLYVLGGKGVDEAILTLLVNADSKIAAELVLAVGQRRTAGAVDILVDMTSSEDATLARASYRVMGKIGQAKDVDKAIGLLVALKNEAMRGDAETLVVVLCGRTGMSEGVRKVIAALKLSGDAKTTLSLYIVLGRTGSANALRVLQVALKNPDDQVKTAAIRALTLWPEGSAAPDLLAVVKTSDNQIHKVLALRGFIKLVPIGNQKNSEKVEMLKEAMELSSNVNEKWMVLSSLSSVPSVESMQLCGVYLDDVSVQEEAALATKIAEAVYGDHPEQSKAVLGNIIRVSKNSKVCERAQEIMNGYRGRRVEVLKIDF